MNHKLTQYSKLDLESYSEWTKILKWNKRLPTPLVKFSDQSTEQTILMRVTKTFLTESTNFQDWSRA